MNAEGVVEAIATVLLVVGTALMVLGAVGLVRLPDVYTRTQAASKAGTLGLAVAFAAVALHFRELASTSQAIGVIIFAFLSVPVAAHAITRAAHHAKIPLWPRGSVDELREAREREGEEHPL